MRSISSSVARGRRRPAMGARAAAGAARWRMGGPSGALGSGRCLLPAARVASLCAAAVVRMCHGRCNLGAEGSWRQCAGAPGTSLVCSLSQRPFRFGTRVPRRRRRRRSTVPLEAVDSKMRPRRPGRSAPAFPGGRLRVYWGAGVGMVTLADDVTRRCRFGDVFYMTRARVFVDLVSSVFCRWRVRLCSVVGAPATGKLRRLSTGCVLGPKAPQHVRSLAL